MNGENESISVFYTCSLCLRIYTLKEDLRGHMIEYHRWVSTEPDHSKTSRAINDESGYAMEEEKNCPTALNPELRPIPFKSFRLLLRSRHSLRCNASTSCAYKFESAIKQRIHAKCHSSGQGQVLNGDESFQCFKCHLNFSNWRQCSTHLWKTHQIDVDLLYCPVCGAYKAHTTVHVWRHMRVHKKWRPMVLRTLRAVQKRRQQQKTEAEESKNPSASNAKGTEEETTSGTSNVSNKNKYYSEKMCEICNRKFVNGKTLSKHVKTVHNKIKPFICNICGIKTARKASLVIHMRQHTGEKPLQCKMCKFSTRDPSVLKKHQQRHNKSGLFSCSHCKYSCIQTISLKRHIRLKHPEEFKKIACDLCNFVTTNSTTLLMHKEDHRRGLISTADDSMDVSRGGAKVPRKLHDKTNEMSADCFLPLESVDSLPHDPPLDTGGVTIPAPPSEDTQFPSYLNN